MLTYIKKEVAASAATKQKILEDELFLTKIADVITACVKVYKNGNKILIAGNGGQQQMHSILQQS